MNRTTRLVAPLSVVVFLAGVALSAQQVGGVPREPVVSHPHDLAASYIRMPLPPGEEQYADRRRADERIPSRHRGGLGCQQGRRRAFWGRIAGTKYDEMTEQIVEDAFKQFGLQNVRRQWFDLPAQRFPTAWGMTASGGGKTLELKTVQPARESAAAPAGGLELEPVWVGLGTEVRLQRPRREGQARRDPGDSDARRHQQLGRLERRQRARDQEGRGRPPRLARRARQPPVPDVGARRPIPSFSIGTDDLTALRELMEKEPDVKVKLQLDVDERPGLRDASVWGELPARPTKTSSSWRTTTPTSKARSTTPRACPSCSAWRSTSRRSRRPSAAARSKFVTTSGHHAGSLGTKWMSDNKATFLAKTAS